MPRGTMIKWNLPCSPLPWGTKLSALFLPTSELTLLSMSTAFLHPHSLGAWSWAARHLSRLFPLHQCSPTEKGRVVRVASKASPHSEILWFYFYLPMNCNRHTGGWTLSAYPAKIRSGNNLMCLLCYSAWERGGGWGFHKDSSTWKIPIIITVFQLTKTIPIRPLLLSFISPPWQVLQN